MVRAFTLVADSHDSPHNAMTFAEFLALAHQRYQQTYARIPFADCFLTELSIHRPELSPKQRTNRRLRVTEEDFLRIKNAW